ncbi:MAG: response regulator [Ferrovibrio sp.]
MNDERPHLLYIDDDPGLGRLVQKEFERNGFTVELLGSGRAGIERLQYGGRIDVVALDHHMPDQLGIETLAQIAKLPNPPPVVYVTGESEGRVAVSALKAGAADYVIKDASPEFLTLLRAAIDGALEGRRQKFLREQAETEMRAARDRFEALANERAVLIREVNHRVSNSLQLIASLLQVQSAAQSDMKAAHTLLNAYKRVSAVARVHKRLYTSADVRFVDLADYLCGLVEDLRQSADQGGRSLQFLASQTRIGTDFAIPIGLIVTELVINAFKYAYPLGEGPIRVKAERSGDLITVQVEDDGIGVTESDWRRGGGIGSKIVLAMVEKIGGALNIESGHSGTCITITFTAVDPAPELDAIGDSLTSVLVIADSLGRSINERETAESDPPVLLLVEDDPLMRMVVAGNLEAAGFRVEEAGSGEEARSIWQRTGGVAAAIIDIGLPDCRGDQLASEFRGSTPHLPIILATGYDEKVVAPGFIGSRYGRVLAKPYDDVALLKMLEMLGIRGGATPVPATQADIVPRAV